MASTPLVAAEAATSTTGSDGLGVFTFGADIDTTNHRIVVDRLEQGNTIDYTVTGARQITFIAPSFPITGARVWLFNGVAGVSSGAGLTIGDTVQNLINDAAIELGLIKTPLTDPFASTDPNIIKLLGYLKSGGRELVEHRDWTHLQKEYTFQTVDGTENYALPSDYRKMVPDTTWNRTANFLGSLVSAEGWQTLNAGTITAPVSVMYRVWQGQMWIRLPADAQTIAYEYQSSYWIMPSGQTSPTSDAPAAASDVVCFDKRLMVARLCWDFRRKNKQDSQTEQDDYERALFNAENKDATGETIYIGGGSSAVRKLNRWNLPDTIT